jgi:hypothetical protein
MALTAGFFCFEFGEKENKEEKIRTHFFLVVGLTLFVIFKIAPIYWLKKKEREREREVKNPSVLRQKCNVF